MKETVKFVAHKTVRKPTEVQFTTSGGKKVDFIASKKQKVLTRVKFKANKK